MSTTYLPHKTLYTNIYCKMFTNLTFIFTKMFCPFEFCFKAVLNIVKKLNLYKKVIVGLYSFQFFFPYQNQGPQNHVCHKTIPCLTSNQVSAKRKTFPKYWSTNHFLVSSIHRYCMYSLVSNWHVSIVVVSLKLIIIGSSIPISTRTYYF